jgi:GntR family transcriptional regulator, carbon starvation induced regulator
MAVQPATAPTDAASALAHLTRDIVAGVLPPDHKLKVRELVDRYAIGPTPLREALSQLAARGLVAQEGQKGFRVPPVTREHLLDITHTRQVIEAEAFRLAMRHGDRAWEDEVVASFHLLRREAERQDLAEGRDPAEGHQATEAWLDAYEARHHRFHRALIAACPFRTLRTLCDDLYAHKTRYRRFLKSLGGPQGPVIQLHEALMQRALARDEEGGGREIADHIGVTAAQLLAILEDG